MLVQKHLFYFLKYLYPKKILLRHWFNLVMVTNMMVSKRNLLFQGLIFRWTNIRKIPMTFAVTGGENEHPQGCMVLRVGGLWSSSLVPSSSIELLAGWTSRKPRSIGSRVCQWNNRSHVLSLQNDSYQKGGWALRTVGGTGSKRPKSAGNEVKSP